MNLFMGSTFGSPGIAVVILTAFAAGPVLAQDKEALIKSALSAATRP